MDHGCRRRAAFAGLAWLAVMTCFAPAETIVMGLAAAFALPAWDGADGYLKRAGACLVMCVGAALPSPAYRHALAFLTTPLALAAVNPGWLSAAWGRRTGTPAAEGRITDPGRLLPRPRRTVSEWLRELSPDDN